MPFFVQGESNSLRPQPMSLGPFSNIQILSSRCTSGYLERAPETSPHHYNPSGKSQRACCWKWPSPGPLAVEGEPVPWAGGQDTWVGDCHCVSLACGRLWVSPSPGPLQMGRGSWGFPSVPCCFMLVAELVCAGFESGSPGGTALLLSRALPPPYLISSQLRPTRLPFPWLPPGSQSPLCAKWATQGLG